MSVRIAIVLAGLIAAGPALAGELRPEEAKRFVAGKLFSYTCFEGTTGVGRIFADGSVAGTIRFGGAGPSRFVVLPAGTLRIKSNAVCASLKGLAFEPCFRLVKTDPYSFRGSLSGLSFAYCNFTRRGARTKLVRTAPRRHRAAGVTTEARE